MKGYFLNGLEFDSEIDWRECLVYLYYEKYHVDNEYTIELEQKLSPYEYIDRWIISKDTVLLYFQDNSFVYPCSKKERLEHFIGDLFSLSISGNLAEAKYLMPFMILSILAEKLNYVLHEIHRLIDAREFYMLVQCCIDNKNIEITKAILEYMIKEVNPEISRELVESLILYANKNENYEMQTVLMEFKNQYSLYQSDAERQKEWEL